MIAGPTPMRAWSLYPAPDCVRKRYKFGGLADENTGDQTDNHGGPAYRR